MQKSTSKPKTTIAIKHATASRPEDQTEMVEPYVNGEKHRTRSNLR